jgi:pentatricopeptide repeat protein
MRQLKQIQARMTITNLISDAFPISRVIAFCALADSGDIRYAHTLFNCVEEPNTFMWNTMIRGYQNARIPIVAFSFFLFMIRRKVEMDSRSFVFVLKACEKFKEVFEGESVHCVVWKMGFDSELLVRNGLIHFYSERGLLKHARQVFDESSDKDVVTWTTMIDGYAARNCSDEAMELFKWMLLGDVEPNEVTLIAVLSACSEIGDLEMGKRVHEKVEEKNM